MTKIKKLIRVIFVVFFSVLVVVYSFEIKDSIISSIGICINVIIPSMFIFMVISTYILSSDLHTVIFKPVIFVINKITGYDRDIISIFLLSLIGGYPIGIKLTNELIAQNKSYSAIADKFIPFCYCISPTFAVTMLGISLYGSIVPGIIIYISNVFSCILIAFVYSKIYNIEVKNKKINSGSNGGIIDSINSSAVTLFKICVIIIFFNTIITVIETLLFQSGIVIPDWLKALLEISNILKIENISISTLPFVAGLASFGGICVILQCISLINGRYSIKPFIITRIISSVLSFYFSKLLIHMNDIYIPAYSINKHTLFSISTDKISTIFLIIMFIILMQKNEKNLKKG